MMSGGLWFQGFEDDEIQKIHLATLEVMQKTGLYVGDDEAMDILEGGGARVDRKTRIVKFPPLPGGGLHPIGPTEDHSVRTKPQK